MTRIALLLTFCVACGGASPPPPAPAEPPSICAADPAKAASRRPKPTHPGCMDQAKVDALGAACNEGDPDACFNAAGCLLEYQAGKDPDVDAAENTRKALRKACDGGIAEACELRVSVAMQHGEPLPPDGCADLVTGCHLGDEQSCFYCRTQDCS